MSAIDVLSQNDVAEAAGLFELVERSGTTNASPTLVAAFERTFLNHPWADPELPSLVYRNEHGEIVGFLGSHVRRFHLNGRPVRIAFVGQLVVEASYRRRGVGTLLLRHHFSGPQDASVTDNATDPTRRIWEALGGHTLNRLSLSWVRPLRPFSVAIDHVLRRRGPLRDVARSVGSALDAVVTALPQRSFRLADAAGHREPLTPEAFLACFSEIVGEQELVADYDEAFMGWLLRELDGSWGKENVSAKLVRGSENVLEGWFIYYMDRRIAHVLEIGGTKRALDDILVHVCQDADEMGAIAVTGRFETTLREALDDHLYLLRLSGHALLHSKDNEVATAIAIGRGTFMRSLGEGWMRLGWVEEPPRSGPSGSPTTMV